MHTDPRQGLFDELEEAVRHEVFPGCVALVWHAGAIVYHEAHGVLATHPWSSVRGQPVTRHTRYDLASLTKVLATTTLAAIGVSRGWLALEAGVPDAWSAACPGATLRDLLEHCSGLPAHEEFFARIQPFSSHGVLEAVAHTTCAYPLRERAVYSDLGFMLLGRWLERVAARSLDQAFAEWVTVPLGLDSGRDALTFMHLDRPGAGGIDESCIAPTEVYDGALHPEGVPSHFVVRTAERVAHGRVHDDNAFVMGGVAGHAGLFGNASAVLSVALMWLEDRLPGARSGIRDRFWTASSVPASTRRLGFDGVAPDGSGVTGGAFSPSSVGHTGYTGASVWIDPAGVGGPRIAILLSNRVHPTRKNEAIRTFRPRFHALAARL